MYFGLLFSRHYCDQRSQKLSLINSSPLKQFLIMIPENASLGRHDSSGHPESFFLIILDFSDPQNSQEYLLSPFKTFIHEGPRRPCLTPFCDPEMYPGYQKSLCYHFLIPLSFRHFQPIKTSVSFFFSPWLD